MASIARSPIGRATPLRIACLAGAAVLPHGGHALISQIELDIPQGDGRWKFLETDFGLDPGAGITIDLWNERPANDTYVMVVTHDQWLAWEQLKLQRLPTLDGDSAGGLSSYLASYWRGRLFERLQASFQVQAPGPDRYHVGVFNALSAPLQLRGQLSLVNPGGQHLSLQELGVPRVLFWAAGLYLASCAAFLLLLGMASRRARTWLHVVMAAVLSLKGFVLLLQWLDCLQISRTGSDTAVLGVGWQLLDKVQNILELMMFLLVALGWKILRGVLDVTEIRFAVGISVISFYLGVFEVACTTQSTCSGYELGRYILHSLCFLVVIVAMNFNLQKIHSMIVEAPASLESGKLYRKLHAYQTFRWVFLAFIIAPTAELFLKVTIMPWYALWLYVLIQQIRTWTIYTLVLIAFRPEPPPLRVFELTRDAASDDEAQGTLEVEVEEPGVAE